MNASQSIPRYKHLKDMECSDDESFKMAVAYSVYEYETHRTPLLSDSDFENFKNQFQVPTLEDASLQHKPADYDIDHHDRLFAEVNGKKHSFSVNVLVLVESAETLQFHPLATDVGNPNHQNRKHTVNLLQVFTRCKTTRYYLITNFHALLRQYYGGGSISNSVFCPTCLRSFRSNNKLRNHQPVCANRKVQVGEMPKRENEDEVPTMHFKAFQKKYMMPIIGIFDFESRLTDVKKACQLCVGRRCKCPSESSNTTDVQDHTAIAYSLIFVDQNDRLLFEKREICPDGDAGTCLVNILLDVEPELQKQLSKNEDMIASNEDLLFFEHYPTCVICEEEFEFLDFETHDASDRVVAHHNHYSGHFVGPAHSLCNVNCRRPFKIPILAHNASG